MLYKNFFETKHKLPKSFEKQLTEKQVRHCFYCIFKKKTHNTSNPEEADC